MLLMDPDERKDQIRVAGMLQPVLSSLERKQQGMMQRDKIAAAMWSNYQEIMRTRRFRR